MGSLFIAYTSGASAVGLLAVFLCLCSISQAAFTIVDVYPGQRLDFQPNQSGGQPFFRLRTSSLPFLTRANLTVTVLSSSSSPRYFLSYAIPFAGTDFDGFPNDTAVPITDPVDYYLWTNARSGSILLTVPEDTGLPSVPTIQTNKVYVFRNRSFSASQGNVPVAKYIPTTYYDTSYGVVLGSGFASFGSFRYFAPTKFAQRIQRLNVAPLTHYLAFSTTDALLPNVTVSVAISTEIYTLNTPIDQPLTLTAFKPVFVAIKWTDLPVGRARNNTVQLQFDGAETVQLRASRFRWPSFSSAPILSGIGAIAIASCDIDSTNFTYLSIVWTPSAFQIESVEAESLQFTIRLTSASLPLVLERLAPSTTLFASTTQQLVELSGVPETPAVITFVASSSTYFIAAGPGDLFSDRYQNCQPPIFGFPDAPKSACGLLSAGVQHQSVALIAASSSLRYNIDLAPIIPANGTSIRVTTNSQGDTVIATPADATYPLVVSITKVSSSPFDQISVLSGFYRGDCGIRNLFPPACTFTSDTCYLPLFCPSQILSVSNVGSVLDFQILNSGSSRTVDASSTPSVAINLELNQTYRLDISWDQTSVLDVLISASGNIQEQPLFFAGGCAETQSFSEVKRPTGVSDDSAPLGDPTKARFTLSGAGSIFFTAIKSARNYTVSFGAAVPVSVSPPPQRCQPITSVTLPPQCVATDLIGQREAELVSWSPEAASNDNCRNFYFTLACREEISFCSDLYTITVGSNQCLQNCLVGAYAAGCTGNAAYQTCISRFDCFGVPDSPVSVPMQPSASGSAPSQVSVPTAVSSSNPSSASPTSPTSASSSPSQNRVNSAVSIFACSGILAALVLLCIQVLLM